MKDKEFLLASYNNWVMLHNYREDKNNVEFDKLYSKLSVEERQGVTLLQSYADTHGGESLLKLVRRNTQDLDFIDELPFEEIELNGDDYEEEL